MGREEGENRKKEEKAKRRDRRKVDSLPYYNYFRVFKYIVSHLILAPTLQVEDVISILHMREQGSGNAQFGKRGK